MKQKTRRLKQISRCIRRVHLIWVQVNAFQTGKTSFQVSAILKLTVSL